MSRRFVSFYKYCHRKAFSFLLNTEKSEWEKLKLSDCSRTGTRNHLGRKLTLNHLSVQPFNTKLEKWNTSQQLMGLIPPAIVNDELPSWTVKWTVSFAKLLFQERVAYESSLWWLFSSLLPVKYFLSCFKVDVN